MTANIKLIPEKLTKESFRNFGQVLTDQSLPPVSEENEFSWHDTAGAIELSEKCCSGVLKCRKREKRVQKMERHTQSSEVMVALKGDTLLAAAPAGNSLENNGGLRAFVLKEGTAVVMNKGTWHWIPFPTAERDAEILVLFRDGTGVDDLSFRELSEEIMIEDV